MRTIQRDIAGAFIFSNDDCLLLGVSKPGGAHAGNHIIPGGGIEPGETALQAMKREVLEEAGVDLDAYGATIAHLDTNNTAQSQKTLADTGEVVTVDMRFHDFLVHIPLPSTTIPLVAGEDYFHMPQWIPVADLSNCNLTDTMRTTLQKPSPLP